MPLLSCHGPVMRGEGIRNPYRSYTNETDRISPRHGLDPRRLHQNEHCRTACSPQELSPGGGEKWTGHICLDTEEGRVAERLGKEGAEGDERGEEHPHREQPRSWQQQICWPSCIAIGLRPRHAPKSQVMTGLRQRSTPHCCGKGNAGSECPWAAQELTSGCGQPWDEHGSAHLRLTTDRG